MQTFWWLGSLDLTFICVFEFCLNLRCVFPGRLFLTWIPWLLSVWGLWYQFCEHCCPHNVPSSAHTHPAEECLTTDLIDCLVCFVWGASEEGLAQRQIGLLEYTQTHSHPILYHSCHSTLFLFAMFGNSPQHHLFYGLHFYVLDILDILKYIYYAWILFCLGH